MTTARALIEEVSRYLTDQENGYEYTHWEKRDLETYLRLALQSVAAGSPARYMKPRTVKLVEGSAQDLPTPCELPKIKGAIDPDTGRLIAAAKQIDYSSASLPIQLCHPTKSKNNKYIMSSWTIADDDNTVAYVYPPVSAEAAGEEMLVSCLAIPTFASDDEVLDILPEHEPAVFEFMLYYAFGVDIESIQMRARSEIHWNNAWTQLGVALSTAGTRKRTAQ